MSDHSNPAVAAPEPEVPAVVNWKRVGLFYAIALAGPVIAMIIVLASNMKWGVDAATLLLGGAVMWMPFVAGWIVERRAGRRHLLAREWGAFKASPGRSFAGIIGWSLLAWVLIVVAYFAVPSLGLPGVGRWATEAEFNDIVHRMQPELPAAAVIPLGAAVLSTIVQAMVAGLTINALFGFGEEYGWRGVLAEELAPLGREWATLVVGVLWGLWHAPLIAVGHNYGADWVAGIPTFVIITVPLAFILAWAREKSGFVLAPAITHGAFNGIAGLFILAVVGADRFLGVPVGVAAALALCVVAAILWLTPGLRLPREGVPARH